MSDKKKKDDLTPIDIVNFIFLLDKYKDYIESENPELSARLQNKNNDEILKSVSEAITGYLELMDNLQKTVFCYQKSIKEIGLNENYIKDLTSIKEMWDEGIELMKKFSGSIQILIDQPSQEVYEEPKYLS